MAGRRTKPSLFAALREQVGLKLEATRGLVEVLVLKRVEANGELSFGVEGILHLLDGCAPVAGWLGGLSRFLLRTVLLALKT